MAFNRNSSSNNGAANDQWRASGFINFFLPSPKAKSGRRKLGAIPLKDNIASEKELREWIEKDPVKNCAAILACLIVEYQSATPAEGTGFDLTALATKAPAQAPQLTGTNG